MNSTENFHKNKIRRCFNRAALTYDQRSYPQQMIGDNLINLLGKYISASESIIDLGCGSGLVTELLARRLSYKNFYAIDISDQLIAQADSRLHARDIQTFHKDFENFNFKNRLFNLVFSNMSLHWSRNLQKNLLTINNNMASNGIIAFTIPLDGTFTELACASRNNFHRYQDILNHLADAGFEPLSCFHESLTFIYSSWITALKSIKATGANYVFNREKKSLTGSLSLSNKPNLSYHIGYFIGRKIYNVT